MMKYLFGVTICFSIIFFTSAESYAKLSERKEVSQNEGMKDGYYVILGAFRVRSNAMRYASRVRGMNINATIGYNEQNGNFYVYSLYTTNLGDARTERAIKRGIREFHDAWIYYRGVPVPQGDEGTTKTDVELNPVRAQAQPPPKQEPRQEPKQEEPKREPQPQVAKTTQPKPAPTKEEPIEVPTGSKIFIVKVTNATTLKEVNGFVKVVDVARNREYQEIETNKIQAIQGPGTQTNEIILLCDIFGFVKQQVKVDFNNPMSGNSDTQFVSQNGDTTVVNFELIRHNAGDVITMYNVYFYTDAALMKPESKFELNSLLDMLKEDESLKVRIHGHTNGNAAGKIIKLKDEDVNFFAVTSNNIEGYGSAKELSYERASVIKKWLVHQGIGEDRMELRGWGGKKMIYSKDSESARRNVRVEIEILK